VAAAPSDDHTQPALREGWRVALRPPNRLVGAKATVGGLVVARFFGLKDNDAMEFLAVRDGRALPPQRDSRRLWHSVTVWLRTKRWRLRFLVVSSDQALIEF
jgi:hypothetical protein